MKSDEKALSAAAAAMKKGRLPDILTEHEKEMRRNRKMKFKERKTTSECWILSRQQHVNNLRCAVI